MDYHSFHRRFWRSGVLVAVSPEAAFVAGRVAIDSEFNRCRSWGLSRHLRFRGLRAAVTRGKTLQQPIDAYREDEGHYPFGLDSLAPTYLSSVPGPALPWEQDLHYYQSGDLIQEIEIREYYHAD